MSLLTPAEALVVALNLADLDDDFVKTLHRGGCTPAEIASRVAAQSGATENVALVSVKLTEKVAVSVSPSASLMV